MKTKSSLLEQLKRIKSQHKQHNIRSNRIMETAKTMKNSKRTASQSEDKPILRSQQKSSIPSVKENQELFKDFSFCLPSKNVDLSPKVISAVAKMIESYGGKVVHFSQDMKPAKVNYLLCSRNINIHELERKVDEKVKYEQILDYRYVNHCVKQDKILQIDKYLIYDGMDSDFQISQTVHLSDEEQDNDDKTATMSMQDSVKKRRNTGQEKQQKMVKSEAQKSRPYANKDKFNCQKGASGVQKEKQQFPNNAIIIEKLQQLQKIYTNQRDIGRKLAYMKAVSAMKGLTNDIQSADDLKDVRGIGQKIRDKIKEIMDTGVLQKLDKMQKSDKNIALGQLTKIWGLGPAKATELYTQFGMKTIQDLRKNKHTLPLTKNQLLGLKYYEQFEQRIPRQRVTKMFEVVKETLYRLVGSRDTHYIQCCGSYRRKKPTCGDVDIIIARRDGIFQKKLLVDLINKLEEQGFLTDHLSLPRATDHQSMSYMGVCQFQDSGEPKAKHHRIDIKNYPMDMFAFAILYFTGSDAFNRSIRLFARQKGLSMSDKGFVDIDEKGTASEKLKRVKLHSEEQIFKYLGLDYKSPQERDV